MQVKIEQDIRDIIFASVSDKQYYAEITTENDGIIAGTTFALNKLQDLGIKIHQIKKDGDKVTAGSIVASVTGSPKQLAIAEDMVIGKVAKSSGIATATKHAVDLAQGKCRIVSGSWKKMPVEIKSMIRHAITIGGGDFRITSPPFIYLDKNYVKILGGIRNALLAVQELKEHTKVIQLKGETDSITQETQEAVEGQADIIMVDSGNKEDLRAVISILHSLGLRKDKLVAFASGVKIHQIPEYVELGVDILGIGREIVDAPLLDMKLDIRL